MFITVFTPTYNRARCLETLYESLSAQSNKEFTWLIIDDGSTDDTKRKVDSFSQKSCFPIKYVYQENGGKQLATENAIDLISTEWFICVDSDDYITDDAIQIIYDKYQNYKDKEILGFYFRKKDIRGNDLACDYPEGLLSVGITELYHEYGFSGETAIVLKTRLCQDLIWPSFENEKFITERVFYNQINDLAPMILCNETICICDYLDDGYTKNIIRLIKDNPYGYAVGLLSDSMHSKKLKSRIKKYAEYLCVISVYHLCSSKLKEYDHTELLIKMVATLIKPHYIRLYKTKGYY